MDKIILPDAQEATTETDTVFESMLNCNILQPNLPTVAQVMSLSDTDLESLCNHMGHNIAVHRQFYRLPSATLEIAKMSQLLEGSEAGTFHKLADNSLNTISSGVHVATVDKLTNTPNVESLESPSHNITAELASTLASTELAPTELAPTELASTSVDIISKLPTIAVKNIPSTSGPSKSLPLHGTLNKT